MQPNNFEQYILMVQLSGDTLPSAGLVNGSGQASQVWLPS
mgnify:FL=1